MQDAVIIGITGDGEMIIAHIVQGRIACAPDTNDTGLQRVAEIGQ